MTIDHVDTAFRILICLFCAGIVAGGFATARSLSAAGDPSRVYGDGE